MKEINMDAIQAEKRKDVLKNIFQQPELYLGALTATLGCFKFIENPTNLFSYIVLLDSYFLLNHAKKSISPNDIDLELSNYIRETEEYKKTLILYKEYIKNISSLLKKIEFEHSIDKTIYIDKLIQDGVLSRDEKFMYKKYKYDNCCVPELLGAKIASGTGVSRNIAGLSRDILLDSEIRCIVLNVRNQYTLPPEYIQRLKRNRYKHVVVGIVDANKKYIFDSTKHNYASALEDIYYSSRYSNDVAQIVSSIPISELESILLGDKTLMKIIIDTILKVMTTPNFYCINKKQILNYHQEQELFKFSQAPWENISSLKFLQRQKIFYNYLKKQNMNKNNFIYKIKT